MSDVIHNGGVKILTGDDIHVADGIRFECQKCKTEKPNKRPKVLFAGLLDGDAAIAVKCSQCGKITKFKSVKDVPPQSA